MDHFGHDHLDNDHTIHTHISKHGEITGTSMKNIFGGKDYWDAHGALAGFTTHNIFGGHDYHNAHGDFMGSTMPNHTHDNFHDMNGHIHHSPSFLHSNEIGSMRASLLDHIK